MPRININEKDYTSPGASLDYANFAVLITGFEGASPEGTNLKHPVSHRLARERAEVTEDGTVINVYNRPVAPDEYNVYEFTSSQDFEETIGLCPPRHVFNAGDSIMYHYGNQMAYELLKLGYTVIYKPISSILELTDENTWEIFKDKSSYDYRFISHGLLTSDPTLSDFLRDPDVLAKDALIALADEAFAPYTPNYKRTLTVIQNGVSYSLDAESLIANSMNIKKSQISLSDTVQKLSFQGIALETEDQEKLIKGIQEAFTEMIEPNSAKYNKHLGEYVKKKAEEARKAKVKNFEATFEGCWNDLGTFIAEANAGLSASITPETISRANACIANLATYVSDISDSDIPAVTSGRGDCIALIEMDESIYTKTSSKKPEKLILDAINSEFSSVINNQNGTYCALTVPSVYYKSLSTDRNNVWGGNNKLPGAFHYLACFMNSLNMGYKEWYAAAGYTRGVASHVVDHTSVKLGEIAINTLEPRYTVDQNSSPAFACNVIAYFRGSYYLWGNRTAHPLGKKGNIKNGDLVASSFLNIRQLCTTIKKQLYVSCRQFTFDPNSDTLWINFCATIKPTLEAMKADQGIKDYRIIKVKTDKKATLKAKIRIIPIEAVEDFFLEVSLEDSFGETTAVIIE